LPCPAGRKNQGEVIQAGVLSHRHKQLILAYVVEKLAWKKSGFWRI
jgi:hypothetical protein